MTGGFFFFNGFSSSLFIVQIQPQTITTTTTIAVLHVCTGFVGVGRLKLFICRPWLLTNDEVMVVCWLTMVLYCEPGRVSTKRVHCHVYCAIKRIRRTFLKNVLSICYNDVPNSNNVVKLYTLSHENVVFVIVRTVLVLDGSKT